MFGRGGHRADARVAADADADDDDSGALDDTAADDTGTVDDTAVDDTGTVDDTDTGAADDADRGSGEDAPANGERSGDSATGAREPARPMLEVTAAALNFRATPGGRKLLTVDEVSGKEETALVKHAPGTVDLAKKAKKELAMLEEERRIDPNKLIELEKKLRDEVARHTPYHERKQTILVRAFQTFDHEKKGTLPLDAFLDVEEPEEPGAEEGAEVHLWMQAEQIKRTSVTKLN